MNPYAQQPTLRPCPECGGRRVAGQPPDNLNLRVELRAKWTPINVDASVPVEVCTNCGHISLFTKDLPTLLEQIQKHPDHFRY